MMSRPTSLNAAKLRDETVAWGVCGWGSYETTLLPSVSSSIAAGEEWRHRQTTHTRRHSDHHCPEGWQCRASAPSLRSRASTPSLRSPTLIKRRFGQLGTKPSQSQQPAHASSDSAQLFRSHAPAYLRGLSRQLSSEELRAGRVGSQVHPQPWFRGADGRPPYIVHSELEAKPLTRSNDSLGRGTASSIRREMTGDSSPAFARHWMVDRPSRPMTGVVRASSEGSYLLPLPRWASALVL